MTAKSNYSYCSFCSRSINNDTPAIAAGQSAEDDEDGKQQNQQQSKGKATASNIKEAKIQLEAAKEANQKTAERCRR